MTRVTWVAHGDSGLGNGLCRAIVFLLAHPDARLGVAVGADTHCCPRTAVFGGDGAEHPDGSFVQRESRSFGGRVLVLQWAWGVG